MAENTDETFMELINKAKQLLSADYVDELKSDQAEMLRKVLAEIIVYVQSKMEEETEESIVPSTPEEQTPPAPAPIGPAGPVVPAVPVSSSYSPMQGGARKGRKVRKGGAMDIDRILNTDALEYKKSDISANSPEVTIGSSVHPPFTAGVSKQMSSMGGLTYSEINQNLLPNLGGQTGGAKKNKRKMRK